MFRSVLIANRGEIACRIIRTAKAMGIRPIAVFPEIDREALHVRLADDAHPVSGYLDIGGIISAAREAGADAIHPGYGFLAENANFARTCADAGITFIGPAPAAIRAMGDKAAAKTIMEAAGVPVVPGYHGKRQDGATLRKAAAGIGWPVLIKPVAGGGGKGMRIVRKAGGLAGALAAARREAKSVFGDDRVLIEKLIARPRHIEVQVFGDSHGNIVHLYERDCSIQRRHQKVIEEAPAPGIAQEWRAALCEAALNAARAVDYTGAGTVEFIVETDRNGKPGDFWFMEMNTRLQVEHPVTETITGLDLVEWQFRVAAGEPLPMQQEEIAMSGHAIEARLYAEDPAKDFLPSPGRIFYAKLPWDCLDIRVDDGGIDGDTVIPPDYDPMIAKIIARGDSRGAAIRNLLEGLENKRIAGVATNTEFLSRVLASDEFARGGVDTGFIERNLKTLLPPKGDAPPRVLALACLALLTQHRRGAAESARKSRDPWSPWARADGWRLNLTGHTVLRFIEDGREVEIPCRFEAGGYRLELPGGAIMGCLVEAPENSPPPPRRGRAREGVRDDPEGVRDDPEGARDDPEGERPPSLLRDGASRLLRMRPSPARGEGSNGVVRDSCLLIGGEVQAELDGAPMAATVVRDGEVLHVFHEGGHWRLEIYDPLAAAEAHEAAPGGLGAPMPGKIAAVHVKPGDAVARGQPLIVVEAMKMEHTIAAPADGTVAQVRFKTGDQVAEGEVLVVISE